MALRTQTGAKEPTTSSSAMRSPRRFIRSAVITAALLVPIVTNAQLRQVGSTGDTSSNAINNAGVKLERFLYEQTKRNAGQEPASLVYIGAYSLDVPIARLKKLKINDSISLKFDDLVVLRKEKFFENSKYVIFFSQQELDGVVFPGLVTVFKKKE
jgi:hypothetical protein